MLASSPVIEPPILDRYLNLLGVRRRTPSIEGLRVLVRAHAQQVPFENISKLYRLRQQGLRGLPGLERYLDDIEQCHFGGTCYANNYYLYLLLTSLGYRAELCGADMSDPDVHLVSLVEVENREYLVDVGYAAPFTEPLPRDLDTDYEKSLGRDRYVLKPRDAAGGSRLDMYRDGEWKHGYRVKPEPRRIEEFASVIADSYREEATFMNALLLARFYPNRSLVIHNLNVIESCGPNSTVKTLSNRDELVQAIEHCFGIPSMITMDVVSSLPSREDAWR